MKLRLFCLNAIAILFVSGCASDSPVEVNVTTKSHTEVYPVDVIEQPPSSSFDQLETNVALPKVVVIEPQENSELAEQQDTETQSVTDLESAVDESTLMTSDVKEIKQPHQDENIEKVDSHATLSSGTYTLQVGALNSIEDLNSFVDSLPESYPVWVNEKEVKGTKWYAVLLGKFDSFSIASEEVSNLPNSLKKSKPYVRSVDVILSSGYPELRSVNN